MTRVVLALLAAMLLAAPAQAQTVVQAHRGGTYREGVPRFAEETMPTFRAAHEEGFTVELDVKRTADGVPVVIHDATLDRTTGCTGQVAALTAAELRERCRVDVLGSPGNAAGLPVAPAPRPEPVPTLEEVADWALASGARLDVEVKNLPTDPDFDTTDAYARAVVAVLDRLPRGQVLVQSFYPPNLDVARAAGFRTSLLTLRQMNAGGPAAAKGRGDAYVAPGWPVDAAYVSAAHEAGLQVVPYTLNTEAELRAAKAAHVDEVITDDPALARRVLAVERPEVPPAPSPEACAAARAPRTLPAVVNRSTRRGGLRVFALQFKQEVRHVVTHRAFRTKVECLLLEQVVPHLAKDAPNLVALVEDLGLATIATGSRGRAAREAFARGDSPSCASQGAPCGAVGALAAVGAAHGREQAAYTARFGRVQPLAGAFLATTDTFGRGFMQTMSDLARRYGVYAIASNNQAPFRESTDPAEIDRFADPDGPRPRSVFVATRPEVFNEAFLWGPRDVRADGPAPLRNVVASNKKVPLTPIEQQLGITDGPSTGPDGIANVRPYALPGTQARLAIATSLPAFTFGPPSPDPCADTSRTYMRCLDALGANVVLQDEANPGPWAARTAPGSPDRGAWQPLSWMTSTWRHVADPSVRFAYNVTPHLVGNLADLPFDGQTAITQRGLSTGRGCHYVGNAQLGPTDPARFAIGGEDLEVAPYAGAKTEFLGILPWVREDGPRAELEATARALGPDGGGAMENDYAEGAVIADLPFPPDARRASCGAASAAPVARPRLRATASPRTLRRGRTTTLRVRVTSRGRAVRGARVRVGSRSARTDRRGRARLRVRLTGRPGTRTLRATLRGHTSGRATLRVRR